MKNKYDTRLGFNKGIIDDSINIIIRYRIPSKHKPTSEKQTDILFYKRDGHYHNDMRMDYR